ncbi:MAG: homoserine kinase, partial [Acidimicrobiia bacterium]
MRASATAPASSANLGPGFDFLALALEVRCRVTLEPAPEWSVSREAETIVKDVIAIVESEGPFSVTIESDIPVGRGLGSSAALAVATAAAAMRSTEQELDLSAIFKAASAIEGHPDNAAAAVYGGLVAVAPSGPRRLTMAPTLIPIVAVPNQTLATAEARDALPATLPHAAAARSAARAAFLIEGLRTGDADALAAAIGDELHEGPRSALSPLTTTLVEVALRAGALHASWSGAGPSVLALATGETATAIEEAL